MNKNKDNGYIKYIVENYYKSNQFSMKSKEEMLNNLVKIGDFLRFDLKKGINMKIGEPFAMCCVESTQTLSNRPLFISIKKFPVSSNNLCIFGGYGIQNKMECFEECKYNFINDNNGLQHMNDMLDISNDSYKMHEVTYNAAIAANEYSPIDTSTNGRWWVPSMGEWVSIIKSMNSKLFDELVDDDYCYLSSTQLNENMCYMFNIRHNHKGKPYKIMSKNDQGLIRLLIDPFKNQQ